MSGVLQMPFNRRPNLYSLLRRHLRLIQSDVPAPRGSCIEGSTEGDPVHLSWVQIPARGGVRLIAEV